MNTENDATFVVTRGARGCHNDKLLCHRFRPIQHHDNYSFSVKNTNLSGFNHRKTESCCGGIFVVLEGTGWCFLFCFLTNSGSGSDDKVNWQASWQLSILRLKKKNMTVSRFGRRVWTLKNNSCYDTNIAVTGGNADCRYNKLWCR